MGQYSKLIASLVGSIVAVVLVYLASKGIGTCVAAPDGTQACTVLGFTGAEITGAAVAIISAAFVFIFPPNKPG